MNNLIKEIHETAKEKGWWEKPRSIGNVRMLMLSEIAEATEEVRGGKPDIYWNTPTGIVTWRDTCGASGLSVGKELQKPEGEAVELADVAIRVLDYFGYNGWQIESHLNDPHMQLIESEDLLDYHMSFAEMICTAKGGDLEKNLGRTVDLIRLYFRKNGWDLERVMRLKMDYNKTRSYKHGGKLC